MGQTFSSLFGGPLTQPGLSVNSGPVLYGAPAVDSFSKASDAFADQSKTYQDSLGADGTSLTAPTAPTLTVANPAFVPSAFTPSGRPIPNAPLTRGGKLVQLLGAAARGATDAIASGALNAQPGKSSFGAGVQGAIEMPFMREQQANEALKGQLGNELTEAEIAHLPQFYGYQASQTARNNALAEQALAHGNRYNELSAVGPIVKLSDGSSYREVYNPTDGSVTRVQITGPSDRIVSNAAVGVQRIPGAGGSAEELVAPQPMLREVPAGGTLTSTDTKTGQTKPVYTAPAKANSTSRNQQMQQRAELLASQILQRAGGDLNKASALFEAGLEKVNNPDAAALAPYVFKALRNRKPPVRSPLPMLIAPSQAMTGAAAQ